MITKSELSYLKGMKRFSGMPLDQIEFELVNLIGNQKGFKRLNKQITQLNKFIEKQENQINKLKEKLKIKEKEMFNLKLKNEAKIDTKEPIVRRGNITKSANTHQLKRIMNLLTIEEKPINTTKIYAECGMGREQCESGLLFLTKNKLINFRTDKHGTMLYSK